MSSPGSDTVDLGEPIADIHAVTPRWVEARLARTLGLSPGDVKAARVVESFDSCSARNTRIEVDYRSKAVGDKPRRLMLRHWHEGIRVNECEVQFYAEIAPRSPRTPTVPCYDVAWNRESGHWHVLLLDISTTHSQAPQPLTSAQRKFMMPDHAADGGRPRPYGDRTYESLCRAYASLHARWWNDSVINEERHCGARGGPHGIAGAAPHDSIPAIQKHWSEHTLPAYRKDHPGVPAAAAWRICERAIEAWPDLLIRRVASGPLTLVQGDAHLGNVFFDRDASRDNLYLLDWDAYQRGIGPWDLACMLVVSHAPSIRRRVESHLLRMYHRGLLSYGVTDYSYDECLSDYRLSILACLFPTIAWKKPVFLGYALAAFNDWDCSELLG
jgi:hypothetical protein